LPSQSGQKSQQRQPAAEDHRDDQSTRQPLGRFVGTNDDNCGRQSENNEEEQGSERRLVFERSSGGSSAVATQPERLEQIIDNADFGLRVLDLVRRHQIPTLHSVKKES